MLESSAIGAGLFFAAIGCFAGCFVQAMPYKAGYAC